MTARASLAAVRRPSTGVTTPSAVSGPLLDAQGARVILGGQGETAAATAPIAPTAQTLFGPRGAVLVHEHGPLIVCDTGHHRVLIWSKAPVADETPADLIIGQPNFASEGRNAQREVGPDTLDVPTGVAAADGILAVADAWNHRVLIWHEFPARSNQPPDVVLGQADFSSSDPNRGREIPGPDTLNWCYGVAIHNGRLLVADTGNRRVLMWEKLPARNGAPADLVLGQRDFITRNEGAGSEAGALGMRWPHAITMSDGSLLIADAGSSRIMAWSSLPRSNGSPCEFVLGQPDLTSYDHNQGEYLPNASSMNMPYGLASTAGGIVIADTANSRLLGFETAKLAMGGAATRLGGQPTFTDKGDNRWRMPARDSLCWPYSVAVCSSTVVIADSGNNRVLLWDVA